MNKQESYSLLQQHHLFARLSETQIDALMLNATRCDCPAKEELFQQGAPADRFYFVAKGKVRLFRLSPSGHEKGVDIVRTGECFAEALMFGAVSHYPVSAETIENSIVIGFENSVFMQLLQDDNGLCFAMLNLMSRRLHSQLNEIENLSLQNALHRLVNFITREIADNHGTLTLDIPKRHLASQLAIQPETLSRLLRKLSDDGFIQVDKMKLTLLDRAGLLELASNDQPLRSA